LGRYKSEETPPFRTFKEGEDYKFPDEGLYLSDLEIESISLFRKLDYANQEEIVEIIRLKLLRQWPVWSSSFT